MLEEASVTGLQHADFADPLKPRKPKCSDQCRHAPPRAKEKFVAAAALTALWHFVEASADVPSSSADSMAVSASKSRETCPR